MANERRLDCVILGLLSHESLTGYEIKKRMDGALSFFWGASFGSIYPTLNLLAKEQLVTRKETKENGREKVTYTITEAGRKHLNDWLVVPVKKNEIRYETLLKLFFGSGIGAKGTLEHILEFEEESKKGLAILSQYVQVLETVKDTEDAHLYYLLTAKFGVMTYEAQLKWCKEAKRMLIERGKK